jgi:hypothetical protein
LGALAGLPRHRGRSKALRSSRVLAPSDARVRLLLFRFFAVEEWHRVNMGGPMTKQEEYVENAVESLELAERLTSLSDRRRMHKLAEAWVELAKSNSSFEVIAA